MGKYKPAIILTLALAVFLVSCKGTSDDPTAPKSWVVTTLAGSVLGDKNGTGTAAQFRFPADVAVDPSFGNLYVADAGNNRIQRITSGGDVTTLAGGGTPAQFNEPIGVAVDSSGNVYVADYSNNRIRKITSKDGVVTVNTIAGGGTPAQFNEPIGVAVDSSGNVYVADSRNHRIRKITPEGAVSTIAGDGDYGGEWGKDDGTGTEARFDGPEGVAVDSSGILYVADTWNHRIRKIEYK